LPDIVLENGVGENGYLTQYKLFNPWVDFTGTVIWVPEVQIFTRCIIKVILKIIKYSLHTFQT
jgi:hypothetical protein